MHYSCLNFPLKVLQTTCTFDFFTGLQATYVMYCTSFKQHQKTMGKDHQQHLSFSKDAVSEPTKMSQASHVALKPY